MLITFFQAGKRDHGYKVFFMTGFACRGFRGSSGQLGMSDERGDQYGLGGYSGFDSLSVICYNQRNFNQLKQEGENEDD